MAAPESLDRLAAPDGALALRIAPDELLVTAPVARGAVADPHAVVERESGFAGRWLDAAEAAGLMAAACAWEPPAERPALAQGAMAGVPVKLWLEAARALLIVPAAYAADLEERIPARSSD